MGTRPMIPAAAIVDAVMATGGNVAAAAERLGTTRENFYGHALRRGIDVSALKAQIRAAVTLADAPMPAPVIAGDMVPFAEPVLAATLVDMAALGMALLEADAALEQSDRVIATLIRELERVGHG